MDSITIISLKTVFAKQFDSTFKCENLENYDWYCDFLRTTNIPNKCVKIAVKMWVKSKTKSYIKERKYLRIVIKFKTAKKAYKE